MVPDWKVDECGDSRVNVSTVNIDLNADDRPQDFGEVILEDAMVACDDTDWPKFKRMLEANANMLSALRMAVRGQHNALQYAKEILDYVDGK